MLQQIAVINCNDRKDICLIGKPRPKRHQELLKTETAHLRERLASPYTAVIVKWDMDATDLWVKEGILPDDYYPTSSRA